ncbi:MAG: NAD-dependent epimerase/dehydratase family protein [Casimicrobiaceae bacterium]
MGRTLIIGANGQIGSELVAALADLRGEDNVIAADLAPSGKPHRCRFVALDVLDEKRLLEVVDRHAIDEVYQLAALLSAKGEEAPLRTWTLNINGLLNVLELGRRKRIARVFWPSSIAAFGLHSPAIDTPQFAVMDPATIYGITKQAGERLCEYYFTKFGVDVRSLRFPGVISYKTPPGGGTTDYAIAIFQAAKRGETYRCFLDAHTRLPMIYMPDALRATLELMQADADKIRVRSSYNLAGVSFSPRELTEAIRRHRPGFDVIYAPDFRQVIAETWPRSIDDAHAQRDWGWKPRFDLERLATDMLEHVPLEWTAPLESVDA